MSWNPLKPTESGARGGLVMSAIIFVPAIIFYYTGQGTVSLIVATFGVGVAAGILIRDRNK